MKAAVVDASRTEKLRADMKAAAARRSSFDSDEVQMYLNKLTDLVPNAPKHRKLTKLEVIQCVIDYICDLEDTLLSRQQVKPAAVLVETQNTAYPSQDSPPEPNS
ncbi:protein extra-macrochaetae-like [Pollicipes pollicipes]|uniref:protein extra-macrochaetae-like n=1 Tax=Pollicipes pollicipes TaxID=41117 RepID=UPI0018858690|nr:protein extra-macrochaetae-like [Pollicipes pollicipes]XP_037069376.1 protein extra-macrochaetae-like [Pollicipes pollicipes]